MTHWIHKLVSIGLAVVTQPAARTQSVCWGARGATVFGSETFLAGGEPPASCNWRKGRREEGGWELCLVSSSGWHGATGYW